MQARLLPGHRGWRWLADGWRLFRAGPVRWLALVFAYWMLMTAISLVPYVGVVAVLVLVPGFSVAFMAASRVAGRGQPIEMSLLFAGFRENLAAQFVLGGVYLTSIALLMAATTLADDGALARWMLTGARPVPGTLQSDNFLGALAIAGLLYMPTMMLFWFAPTLVAWHSMPAAKALFFSLFACLMNWRAFFVYGIASALILFVVPFVALFALLLASGGALRPGLVAVLFPLMLTLMPALFASFYVSYRDVFSEQGGPQELPQRQSEEGGSGEPPRSPPAEH